MMNFDDLLPTEFLENKQKYWEHRRELMNQYRGKWIGYHQEEVMAVGDDMDTVMEKVGQCKVPAYIARVGDEAVEFRNRAQAPQSSYFSISRR